MAAEENKTEQNTILTLFPELSADPSLCDALGGCRVRKAEVNHARTRLRLYVLQPKLLEWTLLCRAEEAISRLSFDGQTTVRILDQTETESETGLERLFCDSRERMHCELSRDGVLSARLLEEAEVSFESDRILLSAPDNPSLSAAKAALKTFLSDFFRLHYGREVFVSFQNAQFEGKRILSDLNRLSFIQPGLPPQKEESGSVQAADSAAPPSRVDAPRTAASAVQGQSAVISQRSSAVRADKTEKKRSFVSGRNTQRKGGAGASQVHAEGDLLYGRPFSDASMSVFELTEEQMACAVEGFVLFPEVKKLRDETRCVFSFALTDLADTISAKLFLPTEEGELLAKRMPAGSAVCVKGITAFDSFAGELALARVRGIKTAKIEKKRREDNAEEKRVELHAHTKMSDMDATAEVADLLGTACRWGHEAIAIADHGVVQAFPDALHLQQKGKIPGLKVLYGCDIYLVDDTKGPVRREKGEDLFSPFVVFDIETTGFSCRRDAIIEIGAVRVENGEIKSRFSAFVDPKRGIPEEITKLTGIRQEDVTGADPIETVLPAFFEFCRDAVMVAHNADFDMSFLGAKAESFGEHFDAAYLDTVAMARHLHPDLNNYKLQTVAKAAGVTLGHHHRAVDDAECTAGIFLVFREAFLERGVKTLAELEKTALPGKGAVARMHPSRATLLATCDLGRINLYRLISLSHLEYYNNAPKIPKSVLLASRDGLLVGSGGPEGELYTLFSEERNLADPETVCGFYDFLEIMPAANAVGAWEEAPENTAEFARAREINRSICALAEKTGKLCAATGDVHFVEPEDGLYRRFLLASKGRHDSSEKDAPLYLRTTEEMLSEFSYLGEETARRVVVDNTRLIARMCEPIEPVRPDKCPPVIDDSDKTLRQICYDRAHELYGPELPAIVEERLERELKSIIGNGYAVMYIIAQKLVWKSNEDGYLVGSRGSVGSSLAATMAGITEVNPLSPHYRCPSCFYVDFDSEEVRSFAGRSGCDMPDRVCPVCGQPLAKEGFDIPFETFLGFEGNKEPDIDLNFSGEYQGHAHRYTEVIFGTGQTFRAGTIGTLAEKTAFGLVKGFFEDRGVSKRSCEINRLVQGCVGVRRTTGQHPGGIIVLPIGEEIHTFTPVQHPANDMSTDIVTTHFDYHSIDNNLLKLDILGHDDPTMIRRLEDLTGLKADEIPLDDPEVMSLFKGTQALGVTPAELWANCPLGTLGVPEFGTDFAMQMLVEAKPQAFSDLVRIAGLAHGTDVWKGNAQTLILEGKATISTAICTRDDIMTYLIAQGVEPELSFTIMESVRRGKGLTPEWEEEMTSHGVPDWYIWSCKKIKYMFPKAHAVAYVMMAWRIAWCKIHRPLEYYAAYFSIRATAFSYELMCRGEEEVRRSLSELTKLEKPTARDKDLIRDLRSVQEMYARGFSFLPMSLYESDAASFTIKDGKLLPPFASLEGMGDKAARSLADAAEERPFISKKEVQERGHVSATIIQKMTDLGILAGLPDDNQLSIFDLM